MKKNKGFTLVELLVTIGIIAVIGVVISVNIVGVVKKNNQQEYEDFKNKLTKSACAFADLSDTLKNCTNRCLVTVQELIDEGLLEKNMINPKTKKPLGPQETIHVCHEDKEKVCYYNEENNYDFYGPEITYTKSIGKLNITLNDESNLAGYVISTSNTNPGTYTNITGNTHSFSYNPPGPGTYYVYAIDEYNNVSKKDITLVNSDFDLEKPKIKVILNLNIAVVTITDNYNLAGYLISTSNLENVTYNNITGKNVVVTYTMAGPGTFYVYAIDQFGNKEKVHFIATAANFDTTPPLISVSPATAQASITFNDQNGSGLAGILVNKDVNDPVNYEAASGQVLTKNFTFNETNTYYAHAIDVAGNRSTKSFSITICPYAPGTTWTFNNPPENLKSFTFPCTGTYKLKAQAGKSGSWRWGSWGNPDSVFPIVNGSFVTGDFYFYKNQGIYIGVGGNGGDGFYQEYSGYAETGAVGYNNPNGTVLGRSGGGGATHFTTSNTLYNGSDTGLVLSAQGGNGSNNGGLGGGTNYIKSVHNGYSSVNHNIEGAIDSNGYAQIIFVGEGIPSVSYWEYGYTGGMQTFTAPSKGIYKFEVWGAKGGMSYYMDLSTGDCSYHGIDALNATLNNSLYPGYAQGQFNLNAGETVYINVGGEGGSGVKVADGVSICGGATGGGGYNGGISGTNFASGSGGASTVALQSGNYSTTLYNSGKLLVASKGGIGIRTNDYIHHDLVSQGGGVNYVNTSHAKYVGGSLINENVTNKKSIIRVYLIQNT